MGQKLGQHFLQNTKVLEDTRDAVQYFFDKKTGEGGGISLLEIGPGKGALTRYIKDISTNFQVVEMDKEMKPHLKKILKKGQIIWGGVLAFTDFPVSGGEIIVVGNLPYYITSPILRKFFEVTSSPSDTTTASPSFLGQKGKIVGGVFLIQKEVADKIKTDARKKSYLWWLLNYMYDVEYLFTVPPESFVPPPKVDSAVIRLILREKCSLSTFGIYKKMKMFLDIVSMYKRKTLGKIEKMRQEDFDVLGVKIPGVLKKKRVEELQWEEMSEIIEKSSLVH